jgi:uroporphyrinogen III methyltransferase/synthase
MSSPLPDEGTGPLAGKRVVLTRPRAQAMALASALEELGAEVLLLPTIRIEDPADMRPLEAACQEVHLYDYIIFTSANGVSRFWAALRRAGVDAGAMERVAICAVGSATAEAIEAEGGRADVVPDEYVAEAIVQALSMRGSLTRKRVMLPRSDIGRDLLPVALRHAGAVVVDIPTYTTLSDDAVADQLRTVLASRSVDLLVFSSGSTVQSFVDMVGTDTGSTRVASIGPVTSAVARMLGLRVDIEASVHTAEGLAAAIRDYYALNG